MAAFLPTQSTLKLRALTTKNYVTSKEL